MSRRRAPTDLARAAPPRAPKEACLVVLYGTDLGRRVPLPQVAFTIGRSKSADLFVDQEAVSRRHALLDYGPAGYTIQDLGSSNGVFVNEARIVEAKLEEGDRIRIGHTLLVFLSGENVESRQKDELHRLMTADPLTHVYNARYFHEALEREHGRAARGEGGLSLLVFDVDGFDRIQAEEGQFAADTALRQLAAAVKVKLRRQDVLGRLGEGSFGVILPETGLDEARTAAEGVRVAAEGVPIVHEGTSRTFTVSLGVATKEGETGTAEDLLVRARGGVAEAVLSGGNRIGGG